MNDLDKEYTLQNIKEQLQTLDNDLLMAVVSGEVDIVKLMHAQLVNRGISQEAMGWVGKAKAEQEFMSRWNEEPAY